MTFANLGTPPSSGIYPAWSKALVELVDRALCEAWNRVQHGYPNLLRLADEDQITDQLKTELVALRKANVPAGFNDYLFGVPTRDSKVRNARGTSIDPTPDLTIYLAKSRPEVTDDQHDALFFECKVIDKKRTLRLYGEKGIQRFIDGWYASRMPHAGMIAYVLNSTNRCPVTSLSKYLAKAKTGTTITNATRLGCTAFPSKVMSSPSLMASDIAQTLHARSSIKTSPPSDILLRHLWLLTPLEVPSAS